jgi:hypothetical protein
MSSLPVPLSPRTSTLVRVSRDPADEVEDLLHRPAAADERARRRAVRTAASPAGDLLSTTRRRRSRARSTVCFDLVELEGLREVVVRPHLHRLGRRLVRRERRHHHDRRRSGAAPAHRSSTTMPCAPGIRRSVTTRSMIVLLGEAGDSLGPVRRRQHLVTRPCARKISSISRIESSSSTTRIRLMCSTLRGRPLPDARGGVRRSGSRRVNVVVPMPGSALHVNRARRAPPRCDAPARARARCPSRFRR